jgi:hypothetical protein
MQSLECGMTDPHQRRVTSVNGALTAGHDMHIASLEKYAGLDDAVVRARPRVLDYSACSAVRLPWHLQGGAASWLRMPVCGVIAHGHSRAHTRTHASAHTRAFAVVPDTLGTARCGTARHGSLQGVSRRCVRLDERQGLPGVCEHCKEE